MMLDRRRSTTSAHEEQTSRAQESEPAYPSTSGGRPHIDGRRPPSAVMIKPACATRPSAERTIGQTTATSCSCAATASSSIQESVSIATSADMANTKSADVFSRNLDRRSASEQSPPSPSTTSVALVLETLSILHHPSATPIPAALQAVRFN